MLSFQCIVNGDRALMNEQPLVKEVLGIEMNLFRDFGE